MNVKEAIKKYSDKFGGFPYFLFLGANDELIIESVEKALASGEEIAADNREGDF